MKDNRRPLIGMTLAQLEAVVKEGGMPRFVAKQLAQWLYDKRVTEFAIWANSVDRKSVV